MKKEQAPVTSGITIRWPRFYDLLLTVMTLGREKNFREMLLDLAGIKEGEAVLDIGSGTGTLAIAAKGRVGETGSVCGIDASPEMVERARQKAEGAGLDIDFQLAVAERLPFPDGRFDVVMNSFVLHHLPMDIRGTALAEMCRVLKPSGRMLAVDFEPPKVMQLRALTRIFFGEPMAKSTVGPSLQLIEEAGFNVIENGLTKFKIASYALAKPDDKKIFA